MEGCVVEFLRIRIHGLEGREGGRQKGMVLLDYRFKEEREAHGGLNEAVKVGTRGKY